MSYHTNFDALNALAVAIQEHFLNDQFTFVCKDYFLTNLELWVYVHDKSKTSEVRKYCSLLEKRPNGTTIPTVLKVFRGAAKDRGESIEDIQRKREEFLRKVRAPGYLKQLG